eukprot:TRINITY_DN8191_c0_g1_i3.p1 TRINITY_DN8191_c0_g1~~TRINITY_DN8191_c0_g1_i3.p1  ORF type:complete len:442 (-),score=82.43 TRINITY_DN8191_c0_g1_i3:78-1403(-)
MRYRSIYPDQVGRFIRERSARDGQVMGELEPQDVIEGDPSLVEGWVRVSHPSLPNHFGWVPLVGADGNPCLVEISDEIPVDEAVLARRFYDPIPRSQEELRRLMWSAGGERQRSRVVEREKFLEFAESLNQRVQASEIPLASVWPQLFSFLFQRRPTLETLDSSSVFPLSELTFFLRYCTSQPDWMTDVGLLTQNQFFAQPSWDHEDFETFSIFVEACGRELGWKQYFGNKLESITACGHFADTYLRTIYFPDEDLARIAASAIELNTLPLEERPAAFISLVSQADPDLAPDYGYVIRLEINRNHVYLLDIPCTAFRYATRAPPITHTDPDQLGLGWAMRLESNLWTRDSTVRPIDLAFELARCRTPWLNDFRVYRYESGGVVERFVGAARTCWADTALETAVGYRDRKRSWSEVLDLVYRCNVKQVVCGKRIWGSIQDLF